MQSSTVTSPDVANPRSSFNIRQQSAQERYTIPGTIKPKTGIPYPILENYLEVEVSDAQLQGTGRDKFIDYALITRVSNLIYSDQSTCFQTQFLKCSQEVFGF